MATTSPPALVGVFNQVKPHFKTVKNGGVSNANSPGYHTSRDDLKRQGRGDNYSIQCPADKDGSGSYAAGLDLTFGSLSELITVTKRLRAACTPNSNGDYDPRIEPLREFIGTLDGRNVCGYNRVATGSGSRSKVGWHPSGYSDSSHLWHAHLSVLRRYVNDKNRMTGIAEVVAGLAKGELGWKDPSKPVAATTKPVAAKPAAGERTPPAKKVIYLDRLNPGQKDSDSVYLLQTLLNKVLGPNLLRDGNYGPETVAHVRMFQAEDLGWDTKSANGDAGPVTVRKLIARAGRGYQYKTEEKA